MKDQLIFDVTDANTIADSDSIGAYVRSSDGTLIDHKTIDSAEWMNVAASMFDGAGNALSSTGGALHVDIQDASINVDLDQTEDSVAIGDGTTLYTGTTVGGDHGLDVNIINASVTVSATDLDIRDLTAASDSVESWTHDGTGTAITSTAGALDVNIDNASLTVNDAALADTAMANAAETLTLAGTAQDVVASPLSNRKYLYVYNFDNRQMFVGTTGVTSANGFPLSPGSYLELRAGASVDVEYNSAKTGHAIRTLELS